MAAVNKKIENKEYTHGGAKAVPIKSIEQLRRSVMSCLLWEREFYEEGEEIVARICRLISECSAEDVAQLAIEAKKDMHLRHVPLLLARELARTKEGRKQLAIVIPAVVTRPDDITELLAMYFQQKEKPRAPAKLPNQLKKYLGETFRKFDEYQLAKWNGGKKSVTLKDAIKLTHPKPNGQEQMRLWAKLVKDELETPDTWEVAISATKDKKSEWKRLLEDGRLGGLALLRNLRNLREAEVPIELIRQGILAIKAGKLLPINFIAAARHNPGLENEIEQKLLECLADKPRLEGKTILVIDTSGSMRQKLSGKSELTRQDVAAGLAIIARELCEEIVIYCTAGSDGARKHATMQIPARNGFALADYINGDQVISRIGYGGIFIVQCMEHIKNEQKHADRIIVITDEQDCDNTKNPLSADTFGEQNYLINIASAKNGIGYRKWTHIDGWSDRIFNYITTLESNL